MTQDQLVGRQLHNIIRLIAGPLIGLLIFMLFRPEGVSIEATAVAAIGTWMAIWWATEATHVAVTALLPLFLFPLLSIGSMNVTAASYAHPIIYLFLGGFIMAIAIERSGLHLRVALGVFQLAGVKSRALVGGFMVSAALISMWISNTSTTLMMLPVAMSVVHVVRETMDDLAPKQISNFEVCMFLGLAYGATMGGVATLVGTPPNVFMTGFMESTYNIEIDFARWMIIGIPLTVVMLPITWFVLTRVMFPINFTASERTKTHIAVRNAELGKMSKMEKRVAILFIVLIGAWIFRKPIISVTGLTELTDPVVAMGAAIAAFLIPSGKKGEALMTWEATKKVPWGVLILFGGGLALAAAMTSSGLTGWMGKQLAPLGTINTGLLILCACLLVIFLTELTSNLATTATFLPIMAAIAVETGQDPLIFVIPVTLAASFAFMLPVATPPNAIVFSSGRVSIPQMMRAGLVLNLVGVTVLTVVALILVPKVFG
ncbi:MAG: DASS family sodium-coupled anion symporter [Robiginitomaculum sp.]